jgi:hypothetical protein
MLRKLKCKIAHLVGLVLSREDAQRYQSIIGYVICAMIGVRTDIAERCCDLSEI